MKWTTRVCGEIHAEKGERVKGDERILCSGDFVSGLLAEDDINLPAARGCPQKSGKLQIK